MHPMRTSSLGTLQLKDKRKKKIRLLTIKDRERRCNAMIIVPVKEGENIERAIKKFKRKFDKTGVIKELRRRQQFEAPSQIKRVKMAHAKYVQQLHANDEI